MKKFLLIAIDFLKIIVIALIIVIPIRYFLFQPFFVKGESMEPNFENGDYLIVNEISYRFHNPKRGDVIVFKYPGDTSQDFIKRVIGLPGERVKISNGKVEIYKGGKERTLDESSYLGQNSFTEGNIDLKLKSRQYFVMGDNRFFSYDSRKFGPVPKKDIIGRVILRLLPLNSIHTIREPA